ncbi:hypothetical protein ACWGQ5_17290 [Streptomyces sp. NPDC055722]
MSGVALGGAAPVASSATPSVVTVLVLVLAVVLLVVLVRALKWGRAATAACALVLALAGLGAAVAEKLMWLSVLSTLTLVGSVIALITAAAVAAERL